MLTTTPSRLVSAGGRHRRTAGAASIHPTDWWLFCLLPMPRQDENKVCGRRRRGRARQMEPTQQADATSLEPPKNQTGLRKASASPVGRACGRSVSAHGARTRLAGCWLARCTRLQAPPCTAPGPSALGSTSCMSVLSPLLLPALLPTCPCRAAATPQPPRGARPLPLGLCLTPTLTPPGHHNLVPPLLGRAPPAVAAAGRKLCKRKTKGARRLRAAHPRGTQRHNMPSICRMLGRKPCCPGGLPAACCCSCCCGACSACAC